MLHTKLFYLAVFLTFILFATSQAQENYRILPNGTLVLDPPPNRITMESNLPTYDNPSYLEWLYSASDGFVSGISSGIAPILTTVIENNNSSCPVNTEVFLGTVDSSPTLVTNWLVGIVILGVFGLICGFSICITCIILCCCRVICKHCGASESQDITPGCTGLNLIIWSPILLVLLAIAFTGCVFGILSYVSFNGYISNLPNNVDTSLSFLNNSISSIIDQLNFTIDTQLNSTFEATIIQVRRLFDTSFGNRLGTLANDLNVTVGRIDSLIISVNMLNGTLNDASTFVSNLNAEASVISTQLSDLRSNCTSAGLSNCNSIPNSVQSGLSTSDIPDISSAVSELNMIDTAEIVNIVANVTARVDSEINTLMGYFTDLDILSNLDLSSFTSLTASVTQSLDAFSSFNNVLTNVNVEPSVFNRYYEIAYKILLAIAIVLFCLILVNIILAVAGVVITLASYDHEAKPSMRKSSSNWAAKLLAFSGYAGFVLTFFLAPILAFLFTFGAISSTVCEPLVDRSLISFITPCIQSTDVTFQVGNFGTFTLSINVTQIFESCQNGESLLQALQLEDLADTLLMNVTGLINETVDGLRGEINPNVISNAIIDNYNSAINTYDTSQYNFNAANNIMNDLSTTQVLQQITQAQTAVQNIITQIDGSPNPGLLSSLRASAVEILSSLTNIESNFVPQANVLISSTTTSVNMINNELSAVNMSLTEASNTVTQFAANLSSLTSGLINDSIATLDNNVVTYIDYVRDNFPRCTFIPGIYNAVIEVSCRGIVSNFNVFWFSLGWALVFLVLSSIFMFVVARYGVRRDHEKWFQNELLEPQAIDIGPRISTTEPTATAPAVFQNQQLGYPEQPPPVYTMSDNYEMKRFSQNAPAAPVLTHLQGGSITPPPDVAW